MAPPKVRFLTKIYHPNIGEWVVSPIVSMDNESVQINSDEFVWISLRVCSMT